VAKQKFGLGKGLDALISGASEVMSAQQTGSLTVSASSLVPIDSIIPNSRQPRHAFREDDPKLQELSASIKEHGLIQPIVVARLDDAEDDTADAGMTKTVVRESPLSGHDWFSSPVPSAPVAPAPTPVAGAVHAGAHGVPRYQIIAGERRWRASKLAGLTEVPVVIKEVTPLQMLEMALIENIQRADLNPIEEALAYQSLMQEFGLTQEQVSDQVGKSRATVANSLRLLQLAPPVRELLVSQVENFTEGHARALVGIERAEDQVMAMNKIIALRLNVRQAEELGKRMREAQESKHQPDQPESAALSATAENLRDPELTGFEDEFRQALAVKVDLKRNAKGRGTLVLHFNNQEELEGLYNRLVKHDE
jgi:ParB-like partition proteins